MRAILKAYGVTDRLVWVADSFEGLPAPNPTKYPEDAKWNLHLVDVLAVSLDEVMSNFERYGLLDERVRFLKGWFRDTLPHAPIEKLAVLRLDGDLYESTMDALVNLYPKLSIGGYAIVDDWTLDSCRQAIDDFRNQNGITDEIVPIDRSAVYWQRTR
ncbi:MAG: TylF/MycF family methyltransferase [Oscillatoria princeps RMCB-10]|nr:TylF/MycF family methyltransferase [Oscillatoria princeps RMCB-10]